MKYVRTLIFCLGLCAATTSCHKIAARHDRLTPVDVPHTRTTPAVAAATPAATPPAPTPSAPLVTGQGPLPGSPTSFAPLVRAVRSSVVSIFANTRQVVGDTWGWSRPQERYALSKGTGFLISESGELLTNNHVVEGAEFIQVQLDDGRRFEASVLGRDPRLDVALLRVKAPGVRLQAAHLGNSDRMEVGDWVVAIGNPYGLSQTVTAGIVSAVGRTGREVSLGEGNFGNLIQTDASINPGNSGGPLLNLAGEVVGINVAVRRDAQGVGFAIPINMAQTIVPQLRQYGHAVRSWLGIGTGEVTEQMLDFMRLTDTRGALVREVHDNSPASRAGVRSGDVIRSFDGHDIVDHTQLPWLASSAGAGHRARLELIREGQPLTLEVTLEALPEPAQQPVVPGQGMIPIPAPGSP
jgi:serine protease Do